MPRGHARYFWPPQDLFSGVTSRYIIANGTISPGELAEAGAFNAPLALAKAMSGRISSFTLSGTFKINPGEFEVNGAISIRCRATSFISGETTSILGDEHQLCKWGGYYGEIPELDGLTDQMGGPLPNAAGPITLRLWPSLLQDGVGGVCGFIRPEWVFPLGIAEFYDGGLFFGSPFGDCLARCTLPATKDGTFDGSGSTGFQLRVGSLISIPGGGSSEVPVVGSFTLDPDSYWPHNPDDGGGPFFEVGTGAIIRNPWAVF